MSGSPLFSIYRVKQLLAASEVSGSCDTWPSSPSQLGLPGGVAQLLHRAERSDFHHLD
jgi:hypothetical protein